MVRKKKTVEENYSLLVQTKRCKKRLPKLSVSHASFNNKIFLNQRTLRAQSHDVINERLKRLEAQLLNHRASVDESKKSVEKTTQTRKTSVDSHLERSPMITLQPEITFGLSDLRDQQSSIRRSLTLRDYKQLNEKLSLLVESAQKLVEVQQIDHINNVKIKVALTKLKYFFRFCPQIKQLKVELHLLKARNEASRDFERKLRTVRPLFGSKRLSFQRWKRYIVNHRNKKIKLVRLTHGFYANWARLHLRHWKSQVKEIDDCNQAYEMLQNAFRRRKRRIKLTIAYKTWKHKTLFNQIHGLYSRAELIDLIKQQNDLNVDLTETINSLETHVFELNTGLKMRLETIAKLENALDESTHEKGVLSLNLRKLENHVRRNEAFFLGLERFHPTTMKRIRELMKNHEHRLREQLEEDELLKKIVNADLAPLKSSKTKKILAADQLHKNLLMFEKQKSGSGSSESRCNDLIVNLLKDLTIKSVNLHDRFKELDQTIQDEVLQDVSNNFMISRPGKLTWPKIMALVNEKYKLQHPSNTTWRERLQQKLAKKFS